MGKVLPKSSRIALPTKKGTFEVAADGPGPDADGVLRRCPETGQDLENKGPAKWAATLWPTYDPRNLPDNEGGRRYQLLLNEQARRDAADEE